MIYINVETPFDADLACIELEALGFDIVATRPAQAWDGRPPETLIIARNTDLTSAQVKGLERFAAVHNQDCVAIRLAPSVGLTVGRKTVAYNEEFFAIR